jgi:hypothetical protein
MDSMTEQRADEHELRHEELRLAVYERRRAAADLDASDDAGVPAVRRLIEAADELLAFEDRLPVLRDLPARALSVQTVRTAALACLLGGVLVVLGVWQGLLSRWWAFAVVLAAVAAVRLVTLTVAPALGGHRRQRWASACCGVAALVLAPADAVFGWAAGLAVFVVLAGGLAVVLDLRAGPSRGGSGS